MTTQILLARHGRTPWHAPNRYTGSSDIPLDEVGERQANMLAEWAKHATLTRLVASPLRRTMSTAAAVAKQTGLEVSVLSALRELDFGIAEGRTLDELKQTHPQAVDAFLADPVEGHWPDGENPDARAREAVGALTTLAMQESGGRVLCVVHSTLIRLVMCEILGIPLRRYRDVLGRPEPTHITTLSISAGKAALVQYNCPPDGSVAA